MAGIYIHIPFCRQACHYCDFHFSTNTDIRGELVQAIATEITLQSNYLSGDLIDTIYFGGGTPSVLSEQEIGLIMSRITQHHSVSPDAEITLEANPDDLSPGQLHKLKSLGINRVSIGIQSFDDQLLAWLNRSHNGEAAVRSVMEAQQAGFSNISIDLIYAIPRLSASAWEDTIARAIALNTPHLSAYTLTIEDKTTFGNWLKKGRLTPVDEATSAIQMEQLVSTLEAHGLRQYEISNFAKPGYESRHNSNYWKGEKYLGVGPSAHSYDKTSRQHNISNNHLYVRAIREGRIPAELETLRKEEQVNEYILTSLRTDAGCDLTMLRESFSYDLKEHHAQYLSRLANQNLIRIEHNRLILTQSGRLLADQISSDLFLDP